MEGASGEEYEYDAGDEDGQHRPSGKLEIGREDAQHYTYGEKGSCQDQSDQRPDVAWLLFQQLRGRHADGSRVHSESEEEGYHYYEGYSDLYHLLDIHSKFRKESGDRRS